MQTDSNSHLNFFSGQSVFCMKLKETLNISQQLVETQEGITITLFSQFIDMKTLITRIETVFFSPIFNIPLISIYKHFL